MNALARGLAFALLALGVSVSAAASGLWVHVDIKESGAAPSTVKINLPFSLLEAAAPLIEDGKVHGSDIHWNGDRVEVEEVRAVWTKLKAGAKSVEKDGSSFELVSGAPSQVLLIRTAGTSSNGPSEVRVPAEIVDALLSKPDGEIDLKAAIAALGKSGGGELLAVDDDGTRVRMWIDGNPEQPR